MIDLKEKNEFNFYEKAKDWNFDEFEIETEYLTVWNMYEILKKVTDSNSVVLDLGTGGGEKVLKMFPNYLKEVIATDYSKEMIFTANKNLKKSGKTNITFKVMDNLKIDLPNNYFDVVVARNTVIDPKQIYNVLKPGGYLLIHGVDMLDCWELKRLFQKGQAYHDDKAISQIDYENVLDAGFNDVELVPIHCREYFNNYSCFYKFLLKVPILNDFSEIEKNSCDYYNKEIDHEILKEYVDRNSFQKRIRLIRRYYGISARK